MCDQCCGSRQWSRAAGRKRLAERASDAAFAGRANVLADASGLLGADRERRVNVGLDDEGLEEDSKQRDQRKTGAPAPGRVPRCRFPVASAEPVHGRCYSVSSSRKANLYASDVDEQP